jgi:hypothetical protein
MSSNRRLRVGVCIVRVEAQPDHLVITITTNRNLDRNLYSARPDPARRFSEPEDAIHAVVQFLRTFDTASAG